MSPFVTASGLCLCGGLQYKLCTRVECLCMLCGPPAYSLACNAVWQCSSGQVCMEVHTYGIQNVQNVHRWPPLCALSHIACRMMQNNKFNDSLPANWSMWQEVQAM